MLPRRSSGLRPLLLAAPLALGCGRAAAEPLVAIDGSSTVYPITEAVAEAFSGRGQGRVTIGISGTGGGFKKLCRGEIAISTASRPIRAAEVAHCERRGIDYVELPIAYDGIAVVVHPDNTWAETITLEELHRLWEPAAQRTVTRWSDLREGWPEDEIHLFGPGVDSGTYDYFTRAVVGQEHMSRGDFTSSEDDNLLVRGISTDRLALGFFGYAYYAQNVSRLRLVAVDSGDGPVLPSPATILDGTYRPLTRPVFLYVAQADASRASVSAFVNFYLGTGTRLVEEVGYVPLGPRTYDLVRARFAARTPGSLFGGNGSVVSADVEQLLARG